MCAYQSDVVVVGSGAGGLVAALAAAECGARTVVLEKATQAGGTTAKSGGGCWLPNSRLQTHGGAIDRREDVLRYFARTSRPERYSAELPDFGMPRWEMRQLEAFCDNVSQVFDELKKLDALQLYHLPDFPDYFAHLAEDVSKVGHLFVPRTPEGGAGSGPEMVRQLLAAVAARGIPVLLDHRVVAAVTEAGRVVGVDAETGSRLARYEAAHAVIFATGGFTHNRDLRENHLAGPVFGGGAALTNEGDFIPIAQRLGATLRNMNQAWHSPIVADFAISGDPAARNSSNLVGDSVLFVNRYGKRTMNEKAVYSEKVSPMFAWDGQRSEYPNIPMFAVWDANAMATFGGSPFDAGMIPGPEDSWDHVCAGNSFAELAESLAQKLAAMRAILGDVALDGAFADRLARSVERFNKLARVGVDADFHRGETPVEQYFHATTMAAALSGGHATSIVDAVASSHREDTPWATDDSLAASEHLSATWRNTMRPLDDHGPYYATILVPGALDTKGGPMANAHGQVVDDRDDPIAGLYAVGNCAASPTGRGYIGAGVTLATIITFAWLAGVHAAAGASRTSTQAGVA